MRLKKLAVIVMSIVLVIGCTAGVYAGSSDSQVTCYVYIDAVDKNGDPVSGIVMEMHSDDGYGSVRETTDENGKVDFAVPPGYYTIYERGYEGTASYYNAFYCKVTALGVKEDSARKNRMDYEIVDYNNIIWYCHDYTNTYSVSVNLDGSEFDGDRVEVLNSDGTVIQAWNLKDDGPLVADLDPGSYTLKEIVEINGYEMPMVSNIMVGCGNLVPVKPPEDPIVVPDFTPDLPDFVYDDFQKWINQL